MYPAYYYTYNPSRLKRAERAYLKQGKMNGMTKKITCPADSGVFLVRKVCVCLIYAIYLF